MEGVQRFPVVHGAPPDAPPPVAPRDVRALWREVSIAWEAVRLVGAAPRLLQRTAGSATAMLLPGYRTSSRAMEPLRHWLAWRGHDARHWGLGTNEGTPERDVRTLLPMLERLVQEVESPVAMVGWSLGGVIARECARERPDLVSQVVTYGTPVIGGPTYTLGAGGWSRAERERISALLDERDRERPIEVPVTAMFTRSDRIVAWPACLDRVSREVEHVEVGSGHLGMILDPDVWGVVAGRLEGAGEGRGRWESGERREGLAETGVGG